MVPAELEVAKKYYLEVFVRSLQHESESLGMA